MATLTTAQVADKFETTPRTLRKFLRDDAATREVPNPGKGSRWTIEAREVRSLNSRFNKWIAAQNAAKATEAPADEVEDSTDED